MKSTVDPAQLSGVIGSIYDCAVDPGLWPGAIAEIARFVQGNSGVVMVLDTVENKTRFYTSWNVDMEVLRIYSERYHADNPLQAAFAPFGVDEPYNVPTAMDPKVWLESRVYREFGTEQGWLDNLGVFIMKTPTRLGSLSFPRSAEHGFSGPRELEILRLLSPHVRRAISITDLLDMRSLATAAAEHALDTLSVPVALVDGVGRIVFANTAASALIAVGDPIRCDRDVLTARDGVAASALAAALAQARKPEAEMGKIGIDVAIPYSDGRIGAAHVLPVSGSKVRSALAARASAAIFLAPTGEAPRLPTDALVAAYGLTPAELKVLARIVDGETVSEAAAALGVAPNTARTHLARIMGKTSTGRQADLLRVVASLAPPVQRPRG